ncbi:OsmC family protein [Mucilaginibacter pallidiroseus]|uniref:OsmC family protein n=1 Tax=Mucilaginibacter pallidiroseus TaxID=2599295 RepID=A0A563UJ34_9SPHI|nr:OsmC family protein [Mucilaginibacter pallidiroseus]TWR31313.1 OsmC family protein [Mucilaginibacter pallidiroseus]
MDSEKDILASANATLGRINYQAIVNSGGHTLIADEPADLGGADTGMAPYNLLLSGLASCTVITLRMYIERKMWIVDEINISLEMFKNKEGVQIDAKITFKGELTNEQRERLLTIADACPVHKMLVGNVVINNALQ